MTLILRSVKGSRLTTAEMDANLSGLASGSLLTGLSDTASPTLGDYLVGVKRTAANAQATNVHAFIEAQPINAKADFLASGDGTTNDGTTLTTALTTASNGVLELTSDTYLTSALTTLLASKVYGRGAVLKPSANSMSVLTIKDGLTLQSGDFQLIRDLRIDATGKTGITGVKATADSTIASLVLENIYVNAADTVSFDLDASQFIRTYNLRAATGNGAGMLIRNSSAGGGGNSHDHHGFQATVKEVGVVLNGTNFAGGVHSNNFYNPQILTNSVCGMAFFTANATIYGGAPEANGSGASTVVVDGKTVKKSSMYLNASTVRVENMHSAEASCNPHFLLETGSVLTLHNFSGYGGTAADVLLVSADSTSGVVLEGLFNSTATVQNVLSWPDSIVLPAASQLLMYGTPVHRIDPTISPVYAEQAGAWSSSSNSAPTANAFAEDADLGYCRSVTFQGVVANFAGNTSFVKMALGTPAASQDSLFTWLVKSDIDCKMKMDVRDGASFNQLNPTEINLVAGKVTRIVAGKKNIATGAWVLYFGPNDTNTATLKISNLQLYQGAAGTEGTLRDLSRIVKHGSFWPGVTRTTQTLLRDKTNSVNVMGKYPGKQVWDTTNNRVVFAAAQTDVGVWIDGVTSTVHTPV